LGECGCDQMDDPSRLMHPVSGSQVGMMHQPYGLPPVNVGVNVGVNMASLGGVDPQSGNPDSENISGRKQDIGEILQQIMNITELNWPRFVRPIAKSSKNTNRRAVNLRRT